MQYLKMHLSTLCAQFVDKLNRAEGINRREFVNKVVSTHIRRMTQMEYSFNIYNKMAGAGILMALNAYIGTNEAPPVILCIGSDLADRRQSGTCLRYHAAKQKLL